MKKIFLSVFILTFSFIFLACDAQGQHTMVMSESTLSEGGTWDFQDVPEKEIVTHKFFLKNESQETLNIKEVTTSCGCTVSEVKNKTLFPNEETAIEVKFDSSAVCLRAYR